MCRHSSTLPREVLIELDAAGLISPPSALTFQADGAGSDCARDEWTPEVGVPHIRALKGLVW